MFGYTNREIYDKNRREISWRYLTWMILILKYPILRLRPLEWADFGVPMPGSVIFKESFEHKLDIPVGQPLIQHTGIWAIILNRFK